MKKQRKKSVKPVVVMGRLDGDNAQAFADLADQLAAVGVPFTGESLGATLVILGLASFRSDFNFSTAVLKAKSS